MSADQHLVDDDLKEQRRDKREELQEERGGKDLAKQMAVLVDGADKPADAEAASKARQARATCHEHKAAVPDRFEFGARHQNAVAAIAGF